MRKKFRLKAGLNRSIGGNLAVFTFVFLMSIMFVFPFVYAIVNSLKPIDELLIFPPRLYVTNPTFNNFAELFRLAANSYVPLSRSLCNTLVVAISITVGTIAIGSMAAYPLAFVKFPGRQQAFSLIVTSLLFVGTVTAAPSFVVVSKLGLLDNYGSVILPAFGASMGVFLMKQFMEQIPYAIIEAATVDGCTEFTTLTKIVLPLVKPAWLTLIIFVFPGAWGNTGGAYIFSDELKLLPTAITELTAGAGVARMGVAAASGVLMMIPSIVIFVISQSSILETMATAGIKE
ncbi:MAG: carbohydrate ABC transporter permease [Clostridia bacterium]|nr:carbohydrate ABC transporter permease [Clostridia bacterium]